MNPFQKWLVWITSAVTGVTGVAYWWMRYRMAPLDEFAVINHPLQPWMLKAHILAAPVMVFAIGIIAVEHIWRHYRLGVPSGRRSGLLSTWVLAPLVLSGYLIQTVTHVGWLEAMAWAHLATGVAYLVGLLLHHPVLRPPYGRTDSSVGTIRSTRNDGSL